MNKPLGPWNFFYQNSPCPEIGKTTNSTYLKKRMDQKARHFMAATLIPPEENLLLSKDFWEGKNQLPELPGISKDDWASLSSLERYEWIQSRSQEERALLKIRENLWKDWKKKFLQNWPTYHQSWSDSLTAWKKEEETLVKLFGPGGLGWNWDEILSPEDWPLLTSLADQLAQDNGLLTLARLLGQGLLAQAQNNPPQGPHQLRPLPGREEIMGVHLSGNLDQVLPSEMMYLLLEESESLFYSKWLEGKLLTHRYGTYRQEDPQYSPELGPILICYDTSGSMRGLPEQMAKALSLALIRQAALTGRPVYLINFSKSIRTLDIRHNFQDLPKILEFLRFSFSSGTDLNPALNKACSILDQGPYRSSDVLIISDFSFPKIKPVVRNKILQTQDNHSNRFFCLTTSNKTFQDQEHIFQHHWAFNLDPKRNLGIYELQKSRLL